MDRVDIVASKDIAPQELAALMAAVGWGDETNYSTVVIQRSLAAYPFVAHARDAQGTLIGYVSAFSDAAFSTFVGELVVVPRVQRQGIGRRLLQAVESYANGVPVYVHPFEDQENIFLKLGYRRAGLRPFCSSVPKPPDTAKEPVKRRAFVVGPHAMAVDEM